MTTLQPDPKQSILISLVVPALSLKFRHKVLISAQGTHFSTRYPFRHKVRISTQGMQTLFPHAHLISAELSSSVLLNVSTYGAPNGCRFPFHARLCSLPRDVAENYIQFIPPLRKNRPLCRERLGPNGGHARSPIRDRFKDEGDNLAKNPKR